jgi:cell division inhibitor SulA
VIYPEYAAGKVGTVLEPEILQDGSRSGRWLVYITTQDMILSLLPEDMQLLEE